MMISSSGIFGILVPRQSVSNNHFADLLDLISFGQGSSRLEIQNLLDAVACEDKSGRHGRAPRNQVVSTIVALPRNGDSHRPIRGGLGRAFSSNSCRSSLWNRLLGSTPASHGMKSGHTSGSTAPTPPSFVAWSARIPRGLERFTLGLRTSREWGSREKGKQIIKKAKAHPGFQAVLLKRPFRA